VCHLARQTVTKKTGEVRGEVVVGVTSLAPERADAPHLLTLVRGHWGIEYQSHWVLDVTFDEDRSHMRCGNIPQILTTLRNTVIGLLRGRATLTLTLPRPAADWQPSQRSRCG
jgi:predicted transposase YbfD/YdcC